MNHRAGYVNIIGKPNAGKSTLMNLLIGEKISIVTAKAQTTRHRILGILNDENYQLIFSDTPGTLIPKYKLQESMMKFVKTAFDDADVILYLADATDRIPEKDIFIEKISKTEIPTLVVINKIDLIVQSELDKLIETWTGIFPKREIIPVSAKESIHTEQLLKRLIELLPDSPPYYPKEDVTDKNMRFLFSEIIREKILMTYRQEIPYSVEVYIESFKEEEKITKISATIYVARESQKGIVIGHQGKALKKVGTEARLDMEKFLDKKVFLEMHVKVKKDWRDDVNILKQFGYEN